MQLSQLAISIMYGKGGGEGCGKRGEKHGRLFDESPRVQM
jgi:hypothetical protein